MAVPYTFHPGEPIKANEVNSNFDALDSLAVDAARSATDAAGFAADAQDTYIAVQNTAQAVNEAGATQTAAVNTAGATQTAAVNEAGATQTAAVNTAGATQTAAVNTAGATQTANATASADRAALQAYLASEPFTDTTALNAYTNASLALNDSVIIPGDGRYKVTSLSPLTWVRQYDSDGRIAISSSSGLIAKVGVTPVPLTATIGSITPDTTSANASYWGRAQALAAPAITNSVRFRMSAGATVALYLVNPGTRKVLAVSPDIVVVTGVNTANSPFGAYCAPIGTLLFWVRKSGAGQLRYDATDIGVSSAGGTIYAVGDTFGTIIAQATVGVALEWNYMTVQDAVEPRLTKNETTLALIHGESGETQAKIMGPVPFVVAGTIATTNLPAKPILVDCIVEGARFNFSSAAAGIIEFWRPSDGALKLVDRRPFYTSVSGDVTAVLPNWSACYGSYIVYRPLVGGPPTYNSGGFYYYLLPGGRPEIGDTDSIRTSSTTAYINFDLNIRIPKRNNARGSYSTIKGPLPVEMQQFSGTTTPAGWTITAPFSVNNGLLVSGTGGWATTAQWTDSNTTLRGGWTSAHKRRLVAMVTINDVAGVGGLGTEGLLSSTTKGDTALMIDGSVGRLRLYYWSKPGVTATLYQETALTSALVAGRQYMLELVKNGFTVTGTLTDLITGDVTTVTGNFSSSTGPRVQGRPSIIHRSGDFKWEWCRWMHDAPRNLRGILIGDSNSEGTLLGGGIPWFTQLATTYGDMLNLSAVGERSYDALTRITDLVDFRPRLAIFAMGTNDAPSTESVRSSIQQFCDICDAIGTEPILATPPPRPAFASYITQLSADITGGYFGRRRYIDPLGVLSNNGDRVNFNPAYNYGDDTHFNSAGHTAVKADALRRIPDLIL